MKPRQAGGYVGSAYGTSGGVVARSNSTIQHSMISYDNDVGWLWTSKRLSSEFSGGADSAESIFARPSKGTRR